MPEYDIPDLPEQAEGLTEQLGEYLAVEEDDYDIDEVLKEFLQANYPKVLPSEGKALDAGSKDEKDGKGTALGYHAFHGGDFPLAMKKAFPGWPKDTANWRKFASEVHVSEGQVSFVGDRSFAETAFHKFTDVIWPGRTVPEAKVAGLMKILLKGVKYCRGDYAEKKYKVTLGPAITRRGEVFDTKNVYDAKMKRYAQGSVAPGQDWTKFRCIWVMACPEDGPPSFYSHVGKIGRFHHSSFLAGEAVMAAGEWTIESGKLLHINACSGHYKPEDWRFLKACTFLKNEGVITQQTKLEVWKDGRASGRELVDCLPFLKDFAANRRQGYMLYIAQG
jgi:hypothetical protein